MHAVAVLIVGACFVYLLSVFAALGVMLVPSVLEHRSQIRAGLAHDDETLSRSRFTIPVSVIAPAFDEEPAIEASVRSLLALDYPDFEVIVINDGSRDATLGVLTRAFALEPLTMFYRRRFDTATVRGVYRSLTEPRLTVVDKENGGKADALNVGLNLAQNRYICTVDSDTVYSRQALLHSMRPAIRDPGRIVGVTSSITIAAHPERLCDPADRPVDRSMLTRWQLLDYLRTFMNNRLGWTYGNFMLCSTGAFAIWRRDLFEELGGFSRLFTCEDIEFTFRVHEWMRRERRPYQVAALAESAGCTEGPGTIAGLVRQRARWHRVITETVWHYRRMFLNPHYGTVGLIGMPYYVLVEVLAPIFEALAVAAVPLAWWLGALDWRRFVAFLAGIALWHAVLTNIAILLYDRVSREFSRRELRQMMILGFADLFSYRLVLFWAQFKGLIDFLRGRKDWDKFQRNQRVAMS